MAIINSTGVLTVDSIPVHTPAADQARLARLQNSLTFYFFNGTAWETVKLEAPETYTGAIIPDNADLGTALQALENAIEAITQDGNHSYVVRADGVENVAPSGVEVPNPIEGDTADVSLTTGKVEKWVYTSGAWAKTFTLDYKDTTNLGYTPGASSGTVTSSTGDDAIIPAVSNTQAGLALSAHKIKLDFIDVTQPVDLDNIESTLATAIQTVADTNSIDLTKTGTQIIAALKLSATQGTGMSVTIESDGLRIVYDELNPPSYDTRAAAKTALGVNKKFKYTKANLDGMGEGVIAMTPAV